MNTQRQTMAKTATAAPVATPPARSGVLQRRCACGGVAGPTGDCVQCRSERPIGGKLQPKLWGGRPENPLEQQADRVADTVMRIPELGLRSHAGSEAGEKPQQIKPQVQHEVTGEKDNSEVTPTVQEALRSPGQPLSASTRQSMESRFGHDFSQVKVHTGPKAMESTSQIGALAYTVGQHIVFDSDKYAPLTGEGHRLLAHELTHVLQQRQGFRSGNSGDNALEQEASTNAARVMHGDPVVIKGIAKPGRPQLRRVRHGRRTFEVGDVVLHGRASQDVRRYGVLLPGPDQAHIIVTSRGELGYEISHTNPDDPFRWNKLRQIVDSGHVDIRAVRFPGNFRVKVVNGRHQRVIPQMLFAVGGAGIILVRSAVHRRIYPSETRFHASPNDARDTIYYESGRRGRGLIGGNALAHELFGHLWLAMQGVPFLHPASPDEARRRAAREGRTFTPTDYARIALRERRLGMLSTSHGIRDPFGRIFSGRVREYIDRFAGAGIGPLQSPTQRVSETHLRQALTAFQSAALARNGLVRSGRSWQVSSAVGTQWEYLSNNYELLATSSQATPGRLSASSLRRSLLTFYQNRLNGDQKYVFRQFLSSIQIGVAAITQFRRTRLANDLESDIRASRTSTP